MLRMLARRWQLRSLVWVDLDRLVRKVMRGLLLSAPFVSQMLPIVWPHMPQHKVGLLFQQIPLLIASGAIGMVVSFSSMLVIKFTSSLLAKLLVIARSAALVLLFIAKGEALCFSGEPARGRSGG